MLDPLQSSTETTAADISAVSQKLKSFIAAIETVIQGRTDTIQLVVAALLADGHVLLEDYPGSGKTTLAKTIGQLINIDNDNQSQSLQSFKRIQFTPDLLPGDLLGVNIFEPKTATFKFIKGPVFSHIVLADEINRTGPKVQAAFLECMAEKQVTIDNQTYPLDELFFVIGTQNPLDLAGTYPLPLVQLDRFLFKIPMSYVDSETELEILSNYAAIKSALANLKPVINRSDILTARKLAAEGVSVASQIQNAIVDLVQSSRQQEQNQHSNFKFGLSTRAALMFQSALKAYALLNGRDYVTEDDFSYLAPFVFNHRIDANLSFEQAEQNLKPLLQQSVDSLLKTKL